MMNNGKLCALIVMLCVIAPCAVGFAWPTSQGTITNYEVGSGTNISADLYNGNVSVFSEYTDIFNNNEYVLTSAVNTYPPFNSLARVETTSVTAAPNIDSSWHHLIITSDNDGYYEVNPVTFAAGITPTPDVIMWDSTGADEIDIGSSGEVANKVIYYPKSNQMYYVVANNVSLQQTPVDNFIVVYSQPNTTYYLYYTTSIYSGSGASYVDLNYGFELPGYYSFWYNGYNNRSIDILLKPTANTASDATFNLKDSSNNSTTITISNNSSNAIYYSIQQTGGINYSGTLGDITFYPYVLVNIDYQTQTISISGLSGMTSFLDDYSGAIRKTITKPWAYPTEFEKMLVSGNANQAYSWFVPRTVSAIGSVPGISGIGSSFDFRNYTGDNAQIQLKNVQIFPTTPIGFQIKINNATTYYGSIDITGRLHFPDTVLDSYFDINNLTIGLIGNTIYLNGTPTIESTTAITSCKVFFADSWLLSVYYYPIHDVIQPSYSWSIGGFGLDTAGFCAVGLIAAFGSGIAAALYGRRSGTKVTLVTLTSILCGAVFLVLLMQNI